MSTASRRISSIVLRMSEVRKRDAQRRLREWRDAGPDRCLLFGYNEGTPAEPHFVLAIEHRRPSPLSLKVRGPDAADAAERMLEALRAAGAAS